MRNTLKPVNVDFFKIPPEETLEKDLECRKYTTAYHTLATAGFYPIFFIQNELIKLTI